MHRFYQTSAEPYRTSYAPGNTKVGNSRQKQSSALLKEMRHIRLAVDTEKVKPKGQLVTLDRAE
jgi:hypothetical protein